MRDKETICDLLIIGAGMTGMAAMLFAGQHGIDAVQVGLTSEIGFASGVMDLLGMHPLTGTGLLDDPWQGIEQLRVDEPDHPYARLDAVKIRTAMEAVLRFLEKSGYPYVCEPNRNIRIITPAGTLKTTYAVPHTMAQGVKALAGRQPCLIVDFKRLRGFSGRQIALSLADSWPDLRTVRIRFPAQPEGELYPERMARAIESADVRAQLIQAIQPHIGGAAVLALPAVLGVYNTVQVVAEMEHALGLPLFEIPTMLPAVTGLRLQEIFEQRFTTMGARRLLQKRVLSVRRRTGGRWELIVGDDQDQERIVARSVLLGSGRFFGKGLHADRQGVRETIFNLPVVQPAQRASWHHKELFCRAGHPINRAGVAVDERFRPVDDRGRPIYPNLFAAGSILAHQDWMRQKCGCGLAVATALGAIEGCLEALKG